MSGFALSGTKEASSLTSRILLVLHLLLISQAKNLIQAMVRWPTQTLMTWPTPTLTLWAMPALVFQQMLMRTNLDKIWIVVHRSEQKVMRRNQVTTPDF